MHGDNYHSCGSLPAMLWQHSDEQYLCIPIIHISKII